MNWYELQAQEMLHEKIDDDDYDIIEGSGESDTGDGGRWVTALIWVYDPPTDEDDDENEANKRRAKY